MNEVTWRVSPEVFSDLHEIIAKHGMGIGLDYNESMEMFGRCFGPDAAAEEICNKYMLREGIPLRVVVDYKMSWYERPEYGE